MDQIRGLAEPLAGKRVLHLSATAFGGGVAEIIYTLVPLMRDAGLDTEWRVIYGQDEFFDVTKAIHNALQGDPTGLTRAAGDLPSIQPLNAEALDGAYDYVIVHDPQPAGDDRARARAARHWIWRCHIDLSEPNRPCSLSPPVALPLRRHCLPPPRVRPDVGLPPAYIWPPAIDPLAPKNMALSPEDAAYIVDQFGIDVRGPSSRRFPASTRGRTRSGSSRPGGSAARRTPDVQLALVGSMAHDDPEGWEYYSRTVAAADGHPDIYILSNLNNVGSVEVNAFQVHSAASAEVDPGGLRPDGHGGALEGAADGRRSGRRHRRPDPGRRDRLPRGLVEECAERARQILDDPAGARADGAQGKEFVRRRFLTPRLLRDWLALFNRSPATDTGDAELAAAPGPSSGPAARVPQGAPVAS